MSTASFSDFGRIVVIIPTFNEIENLPVIVGRVRSRTPTDMSGGVPTR